MRRYLLLIPIISLSFTFVADILKQLDIAEDQAREYIFSDFQEGSLQYPYSKLIKSYALGQRAQAVNDLGDFIKKYTQSPDFINTYTEHRNNAKPKGPGNLEDKVQARLEEIARDIKSQEEDMKKAGGDMKKLYEASIQMLKDEQKALKNPSDPNRRMYLENLSEGGMVDQEQYKEELKNFEEQWPATSKELVKKRLREFLTLTADIDFDAKLVGTGKIKKFADPKLEAKNGDWKKCFRAGKETITAARAYAQKWLTELH